MSSNILPRNWFNKNVKSYKNQNNVLNLHNSSILNFPKKEIKDDIKISEDQIKITFNGVDTFNYFSDLCRNFDKMLVEIETKIDREKIDETHSGVFNYPNLNYKVFWTYDMNKILILDIVTEQERITYEKNSIIK